MATKSKTTKSVGDKKRATKVRDLSPTKQVKGGIKTISWEIKPGP